MAHPVQNLNVETIKFTYADYLTLPDDGRRYEVIKGELFMTPAPTTKHQKILFELGKRLDAFVSENRLGTVLLAPCDVVLTETDIVQPDILFISKERRSIITDRDIRGAPDLVIEITSPTSEERDLVFKKKLYAKFGVKEYWIVFAEDAKVEVWKLEKNIFLLDRVFEKEDTLKSPSLQGLEIELSEVFRKIEDYF